MSIPFLWATSRTVSPASRENPFPLIVMRFSLFTALLFPCCYFAAFLPVKVIFEVSTHVKAIFILYHPGNHYRHKGEFSHNHKRLVIWVLLLGLLCAIFPVYPVKVLAYKPAFLSRCSHTGFEVFSLLAFIKLHIPLIYFMFLIYSIGIVRSVHVGTPIAQKNRA